MTERRRLRNRRTRQVVTFSLGGFTYTCGVGRYPDHTVGEIFIDASAKSGTAVAAAAQDSAIVASLAIQFGVPLEVIRHAVLRDERDQAVGPLGRLLDLLAEGEVS